ncbi:uncharacterized protein BDZ99DRAFT_569382 [Mytilinidion resinicola]|uniref:Zn(2)-C6 fungal-type domain-containing protein n=1 Tax=Mytilinidion resinicola TaxID=574789 RepID=A0A6A6YVI1_9PEZI|nr:uncharacterized protein BDZ99DRAFT_569382 [Mytilinidion resinicola]KAF2812770.1 hypothetical protein BDZ99DRAFT_569382 [Mytilinidion resinicola]
METGQSHEATLVNNGDLVKRERSRTMDRHSSSDPLFYCQECGRGYKTVESLNCHHKNHSSNKYVCHICQVGFKRKDLLHRHLTQVHKWGSSRRASKPRGGDKRPCVRCSQRKIKCDRLSPCSGCTRGKHSCQYPTPPKSSISPFATIGAFPNPNATTASHVPPNLALSSWSGNLYSQNTDPGRDNHSQLSPETTTTLPSSGTATMWHSPEPQNAAMAYTVVCSGANELPTVRHVRSFSMMETTPPVVKTEAPSQIHHTPPQENVRLREENARLREENARLQENARLRENVGLQEIARLREEIARLEEKIARNRWLNETTVSTQETLSNGSVEITSFNTLSRLLCASRPEDSNFMAQPLYSPTTSTWNFQDSRSATSNSFIAPQPIQHCESYSGKCSVCCCPNFEMDSGRYCTTRFYKDLPPRMCKECGHQDSNHAPPGAQVWAANAGSVLV